MKRAPIDAEVALNGLVSVQCDRCVTTIFAAELGAVTAGAREYTVTLEAEGNGVVSAFQIAQATLEGHQTAKNAIPGEKLAIPLSLKDLPAGALVLTSAATGKGNDNDWDVAGTPAPAVVTNDPVGRSPIHAAYAVTTMKAAGDFAQTYTDPQHQNEGRGDNKSHTDAAVAITILPKRAMTSDSPD